MRKLVASCVITLGIGVAIGFIGAGADSGIKTFEPGTPIVAADVNANFSALVDALGTRQARVNDECPPGSAIRVVAVDGGVVCQAVADGPDAPFGAENVLAGPGIDLTASNGDVEVSLDTGFTDERYATRTEVDALLADNADAHGRIDAASRLTVGANTEVVAGAIGSSDLSVWCPEGYVATGGGAFVHGRIARADVAWLTTWPGTNDRDWRGEVRWTAPRTENQIRTVYMYAVCLRTL